MLAVTLWSTSAGLGSRLSPGLGARTVTLTVTGACSPALSLTIYTPGAA